MKYINLVKDSTTETMTPGVVLTKEEGLYIVPQSIDNKGNSYNVPFTISENEIQYIITPYEKWPWQYPLPADPVSANFQLEINDKTYLMFEQKQEDTSFKFSYFKLKCYEDNTYVYIKPNYSWVVADNSIEEEKRDEQNRPIYETTTPGNFEVVDTIYYEKNTLIEGIVNVYSDENFQNLIGEARVYIPS